MCFVCAKLLTCFVPIQTGDRNRNKIYIWRVHSDDFVWKALTMYLKASFVDVLVPSDIACVIALVKNSREMREDERDGEGSNGYTVKEGTTIVHAGRRLEAS